MNNIRHGPLDIVLGNVKCPFFGNYFKSPLTYFSHIATLLHIAPAIDIGTARLVEYNFVKFFENISNFDSYLYICIYMHILHILLTNKLYCKLKDLKL